MMTDPVADMLTRIRNAVQVERPYVDVPASKLKIGIAEALQREGILDASSSCSRRPSTSSADSPPYSCGAPS